ncbi:MAG TPA: hypothetical protein VN647_06510 [Nitrospira sp.]|nr:hypothetical protein [Nitrospira sp.]
MSRINLDPLLTFPDGSHLVISTQFSAGEDFSCALYSAVVGNDDCVTFRVISNHFTASTCMSVQESAYNYALRLYPDAAAVMKKPPYLIWHGPRSSRVQ